MTRTFQVLVRRFNTAAWEVYGTFTSEAEFKQEMRNIRALGLYSKRVPL
jgi:hypothetical protein